MHIIKLEGRSRRLTNNRTTVNKARLGKKFGVNHSTNQPPIGENGSFFVCNHNFTFSAHNMPENTVQTWFDSPEKTSFQLRSLSLSFPRPSISTPTTNALRKDPFIHEHHPNLYYMFWTNLASYHYFKVTVGLMDQDARTPNLFCFLFNQDF